MLIISPSPWISQIQCKVSSPTLPRLPKQMTSFYYGYWTLESPDVKCIPPCFKNCSVSEEEGTGWGTWKECLVWKIIVIRLKNDSYSISLRNWGPWRGLKALAKPPKVNCQVSTGGCCWHGGDGAELSGKMQRLCSPPSTKRELQSWGPSLCSWAVL